MPNLEIYNNDFQLQIIDPPFETLYWRRRFNRHGEFKLKTNFTQDRFDYFSLGHIVYKRDVDEGCFITERNVIETFDGGLELYISGISLTHILDWRIIEVDRRAQLGEIIQTNILNNNFFVGAGNNRRINQFRQLPFAFPNIIVDVNYNFQNAYEMMYKLLEEHDIGMKVVYNISNKTFDLMFYNPIKTYTIFSREYASITQQDYVDDITNYRNVVIVGENDLILNNNVHLGFNRREVATSLPSDDSVNLRQWALNTLNEHQEIRTLSSTINVLSKQFEYIKDWDLGSIVLSENKVLKFSEHEIITEITEIHDAKGMNLEVNLGSYKER